jgi:hypothetical protein
MEMVLLAVALASLLVAAVATGAAWKYAREHREREAARVASLKTLAFGDDESTMFGASVERGAPPRLAALAAVAVVMLAVAGLVFGLHETSRSARDSGAAGSLDLLALRQTTDPAGRFVVSGEVKNDANGRKALEGVTAYVDLFDREGRFVTGDRSEIAAPVLRAGEAATFAVTLPKASGIARYRVRFRLEDGSPLPHVDRRAMRAAREVERTAHENAN